MFLIELCMFEGRCRVENTCPRAWRGRAALCISSTRATRPTGALPIGGAPPTAFYPLSRIKYLSYGFQSVVQIDSLINHFLCYPISKYSHPSQARAKVQNLFRKNSHVGDPVIVDMLVKKGYMELEETLMQWKQKTHLLRLLAADTETPRKYKNKKTVAEKFFSNTLNPDD